MFTEPHFLVNATSRHVFYHSFQHLCPGDGKELWFAVTLSSFSWGQKDVRSDSGGQESVDPWFWPEAIHLITQRRLSIIKSGLQLTSSLHDKETTQSGSLGLQKLHIIFPVSHKKHKYTGAFNLLPSSRTFRCFSFVKVPGTAEGKNIKIWNVCILYPIGIQCIVLIVLWEHCDN